MGKWKQISGDMTWEKHGLLLAKVNRDAKSVDLVRIEPWAEHDHSAQLTHGLYLVDEGYFDYSDFDVVKNEDTITSALETVGMELREFKRLPPEGKAEVLASYQGLGGDSRSTNSLIDALPVKPENIEFWGGPETTEKVERYARDELREAVEHHFHRKFDFGEMPDDETMKFAWGDDNTVEFEMDDEARSGLGYAKLYAKIPLQDRGQKSHTIDNLEDFQEVVRGLANAPIPKDGLTYDLKIRLERYLGHPENMDEDELQQTAIEMGESAHALATQLMETIGFSW